MDTNPSLQTLKISGKSGRHYEHPKEEGEKTSAGKIWRSERNVGHFSRSFAFPQAVDQDEVKATLKNGILTLTVPKTRKEKTTKKIAIS
jgi:HSP20 family protein